MGKQDWEKTFKYLSDKRHQYDNYYRQYEYGKVKNQKEALREMDSISSLVKKYIKSSPEIYNLYFGENENMYGMESWDELSKMLYFDTAIRDFLDKIEEKIKSLE